MFQRKYTNRKFLDALTKRVLVYDGAMGTSLQKMKLTAPHRLHVCSSARLA